MGSVSGGWTSRAMSDPLYVGRRWVHDDRSAVVVVNWQAPAARPFYTATPAEPHGVTLRRRFRARGRQLLDLSDEALDGSVEDALGSVDDLLLEELERSRDARMRDIVATIQADQYRLIARDPLPPLVIQGGPGTGKTAVGLHRASFLLYSHRRELARVLVVGPNPTFMDYVSHVLPALGEDAVEQRAVGRARRGRGGDPRRSARRPAAQGRRPARRGRAASGGAEGGAAAGGARRPARRRVRRAARGRGGGAPGRDARRARPLGGRAGALPHAGAPAVLPGLRRAARRARHALLRGGRARAAQGGTPDALARPLLARASARRRRPAAARVAGPARRGGGRDPRRGRAAAARPSRARLERRRPAAPRRGSVDARRAA